MTESTKSKIIAVLDLFDANKIDEYDALEQITALVKEDQS